MLLTNINKQFSIINIAAIQLYFYLAAGITFHTYLPITEIVRLAMRNEKVDNQVGHEQW